MASKNSLQVLLTFACISCTLATRVDKFPFIKDASSVTPNAEGYDYIIIGGGTSGCPLATTLCSSFKVLVLERGASPYGNPNITRREGFESNLKDTGPHRPMQEFSSTEGTPNVRGRVLGGGSSVNAGFYTRASRNYIRRTHLDEELVENSYDWVETVVPSLLPPEKYQAVVRKALLEAGVVPDNGATFEHLIGTKTSGTLYDSHGFRHPASDLFVYANGDNLQVLLRATVHRILFTDNLRAYGVVYTDSLGEEHVAHLNNLPGSEIVLSAGALGSPQLLLLSGVGPEQHINEMGIPLVLDSPHVGKYAADNPQVNIWIASPTYIVPDSREQVVGITNFSTFIKGGSRTNTGHMGAIVAEVTGPESLGVLQLGSLDPEDNPKVTYNYFQEPKDLELCIAGLAVLEEMVLSDAYEGYRFDNQSLPSGGTVGEPHRRDPAFSANEIDSALAKYCLENYTTGYHYHGGCRVGKVIDHDYRVIGVHGLRVVDGSTFDVSPGTNPQATVMMTGRYVGVKMLEERTQLLSSS